MNIQKKDIKAKTSKVKWDIIRITVENREKYDIIKIRLEVF